MLSNEFQVRDLHARTPRVINNLETLMNQVNLMSMFTLVTPQ